jgi:hypothetical protein
MFETDLDCLFQDMAVDVVSGSVTFKGIFDMPDELIASDVFVSTEYKLTVKSSDISTLQEGAALTIKGVAYEVRIIKKLDDGLLSVLILGKA